MEGDAEGNRLPSPIVSAVAMPPSAGNRCTPDGDGVGWGGNGHRYGRRHGVLDFSGTAEGGSTQRTFASFGYEWNAFDGIREEDEDFSEVYFRDLDLPSLKGKVGLNRVAARADTPGSWRATSMPRWRWTVPQRSTPRPARLRIWTTLPWCDRTFGMHRSPCQLRFHLEPGCAPSPR